MARRHGGPRHDHVARGISGNSPSLLNGHGVTHAAEDYLACTVLACSALDDVEEYGIAEAWGSMVHAMAPRLSGVAPDSGTSGRSNFVA